MRDCLIITPTRKRLFNAQRLIDEVAKTSTAQTDLVLAVDDDDGSYAGLKTQAMAGRVWVSRSPRQTCPEWSNQLALRHGHKYRAVASLGDDHVPQTYGWDSLLLDAIKETGGAGIAYGNDTLQGQNLPTAPVVSSNIVYALGWLFLPAAIHLFCDNVWKDLAEGAGCLTYLPEVIVKHYHPAFGTAPMDITYAESAPSWVHDEAAYHAWRRDPEGMAKDIAKVRALCQRGQS